MSMTRLISLLVSVTGGKYQFDWTVQVSVETRQDWSMLSCSLSQIMTPPFDCCRRNRDSSDNAMFFKSSIVQFWWACANCSLRFLFLADRSGNLVWTSAAVAHLLQGLTCCAFRDGILHTLVVTNGYLSNCYLSVISNQSVHSPRTLTRNFRPHNCRPLDIFYLSDHSL